MRARKDLGVVETIYEEEHEDASRSPSFSASTPSPSSSSPSSSSLQTKVEEWSRMTGCKVDIQVRIHGQCFQLHKERLASRSAYFRRRSEESTFITVAPPFNMTAETFAAVADFCYGGDVALSPFNVVILSVAAAQLEMTEEDCEGGWNLAEKTEEYFSRAVLPYAEYAVIALRACLDLLSETEQAAAMASCCVETLAAADVGAGWLDDLASLSFGDFRLVASYLRERCSRSHDLLYRVVDFYLENHTDKLTEEEKDGICYVVDTKRLSAGVLVRLMQNPRMPLRFIVQAMLMEQLLTRRAVFDCVPGAGGATLGGILRRDAAIRQEAHLRTNMESTGARVQALEREIAEIKKRLRQSSPETDRGRSASCRFFGPEERVELDGWAVTKPSMGSSDGKPQSKKKSLGKVLFGGLKNAFRRKKTGFESVSTGCVGGEERDSPLFHGKMESRRSHHRRHHSFA